MSDLATLTFDLQTSNIA